MQTRFDHIMRVDHFSKAIGHFCLCTRGSLVIYSSQMQRSRA